MADEPMSPAEIQRALERHDRALMNAVPTDAWARENEHLRQYVDTQYRGLREHVDDVEESLTADIKEMKERGQMTRGQLIAVLSAVAGVVATVVAAYISTKGIK